MLAAIGEQELPKVLLLLGLSYNVGPTCACDINSSGLPRTLGNLHLKLNLFAVVERPKTVGLDGSLVNKHVRKLFCGRRDEAKALGSVKEPSE